MVGTAPCVRRAAARQGPVRQDENYEIARSFGGGTMRVYAKWALIAFCVATMVAPAGAQGAAKTTVTGAPPFTLGMPLAEVLHNAPAFQPISAACPLQRYTFDRVLGLHVVTEIDTINHVPTKNYWTRMPAPLGGHPYTALVNLCFYQDKLAYIRVMWNHDAFNNDSLEWFARAQDLQAQLNASYAPELIKRNYIDRDIGGQVQIRDTQGNLLGMWVYGVSTGFSIILDYTSGPYEQAINGSVTLEGSY